MHRPEALHFDLVEELRYRWHLCVDQVEHPPQQLIEGSAVLSPEPIRRHADAALASAVVARALRVHGSCSLPKRCLRPPGRFQAARCIRSPMQCVDRR